MTIKNEYPWLKWAVNEIGTKRLGTDPGNPKIIGYWKSFGMGGIKNERVSWCSAFVGAALESVGINTNSDKDVYKIRTKDSSQYWLYWQGGTQLLNPTYGCIGVMSRKGGGHVGFVVGKTEDGKFLLMLGGNQGSAVNIKKFPIDRFVGYILPKGYEPNYTLPIDNASIELDLD